jgi:hypothetical protein
MRIKISRIWNTGGYRDPDPGFVAYVLNAELCYNLVLHIVIIYLG